MTTIQSLLQPLNLKKLVPALTRLRQADPQPFYLLKLRTAPIPPALSRTSLALNRRLSNSCLQQHSGNLSIWSPHHLQRLVQARTARIQERVILKNPYKSEELIAAALQAGVRQMVVDCPQEIDKIEAIGRQHAGFKSEDVKYLWFCGEETENGEELAQAKGVRGLTFEWSDNASGKRIDAVATAILQEAHQIEQIVCSGTLSNLEELRKWERQPLSSRGRNIAKLVEVTDFSDVDSFILATRNLSSRRPLIDPAALELVQGVDYERESLLVRCGEEEWLVSRVKQLPLEEESCLYNWERGSRQEERGVPQMISL